MNDTDQDDSKKLVLYNHFNILVKTQLAYGSSDDHQIVGFEIEPRSYAPSKDPSQWPRWKNSPHEPLLLDSLYEMPDADRKVAFTYSFRTEVVDG